MRHRNFASISAKVIVWMFVLAAAAFSFHDIVSLFGRIGAQAPFAYLAPVFIDGITWLGKLMRSRSLSKSTNRTGLVYLSMGGSASLAANLLAGETLGMKLLGLLAVTGFILGEIALDKIEARPAPIVVTADDEVRAKRSAAAQRGAVTRKANAAKRKPTRKARVPQQRISVDELEQIVSA